MPTTKAKYFAALLAHDWGYAYSDDARSYRKGLDNDSALLREAEADPELAEMYRAFSKWAQQVFAGNGNAAKPELTDFIPA